MPKVLAKDPERLDPVHPGEVLLNDFLEPNGITPHRLARETGMPVSRVAAIIKCDRGVTADTAHRLARYFGVSPEIWIGLQMRYELEAWEIEHGHQLDREVRPMAQAS